MKHDNIDGIIKAILIIAIVLCIYFFQSSLSWYISLFSNGILTFFIALFIAYVAFAVTYRIITEILDIFILIGMRSQIYKYSNSSFLLKLEDDFELGKKKLSDIGAEIILNELGFEESDDETTRLQNIFKIR